MVEWISTKIPKDLYNEIEKFIQSEKGKEAGFTSKTAFITHTVREILNAYNTGAIVKAIDPEKIEKMIQNYGEKDKVGMKSEMEIMHKMIREMKKRYTSQMLELQKEFDEKERFEAIHVVRTKMEDVEIQNKKLEKELKTLKETLKKELLEELREPDPR